MVCVGIFYPGPSHAALQMSLSFTCETTISILVVTRTAHFGLNTYRLHIVARISYLLNFEIANYNDNNIYLTAIGLSPGGSGFKHIYKYLTLCLWNLHLHRCGLYEKHVVTSWIFGNHLSICFQDTGKPRKKTCIEVAGRRTFRTLTFSQRSGI